MRGVYRFTQIVRVCRWYGVLSLGYLQQLGENRNCASSHCQKRQQRLPDKCPMTMKYRSGQKVAVC